MTDYANVPQALKDLPHWIVWKLEWRKGKSTKVPYAVGGGMAKSNDPQTWTTFGNATMAVADTFSGNDYDGVGFMLQGTPFVGIDFDGVVVNGMPEPFVLTILELLGNPYSEITPSGQGLRCFVECASLPEGNRKFSQGHYGAEIYIGNEGGRYLTVTGNRYSGDGIPKVDDISIPYFLIAQLRDVKFKRLWIGDASDFDGDQSRADLALMGLLSRRLSTKDPDTLLRFFNASVPGHREKWVEREDYRVRTITKICQGGPKAMDPDVEPEGEYSAGPPSPYEYSNNVIEARKVIEFHEFPTEEEKAKWTPFDYVLEALEGQFDGWFPRGAPSLLGGSGGSGKTTFMLDLCVSQANGSDFYGHKSFGLSYLVLMLDRGSDSHIRTMRRMGFTTGQIPIKFLPPVRDAEASQSIIDKIEECEQTPQLVFIEGLDLLVSDPNSMEVVSPFVKELQQIAEHFHLALVGSVGAPKTKPKEGYLAKRDTIFGSAVWSRMTETVVTIQYVGGDDMADQRIVSVLPRNAKAESFTVEFQKGRLAVLPPEPEKAPPPMPHNEMVRLKAEEDRKGIENAILDILQGGPMRAEDVKEHLRELHGFSGAKIINDVSGDMVKRNVLRKGNVNGKWLWESVRVNATLSKNEGGGGVVVGGGTLQSEFSI